MLSKARLELSVLGTALVMGILADALLRAVPWGLNLLIWMAALSAAITFHARWREETLSGGGQWLLVVVALFALGTRLARFPRIENTEPFGGPHGAFPGHLAGTRGPGSFCRPCRVRLGSGCCRAQRCLWIAASPIRGGRVEEATRWSVVAARDGGGARSSSCSPLPTHIWRAVHGGGRGVRQHRQENLPRELPASIYPLLCGRLLRLVCRWIPARHAVGQGDISHRGETPPFASPWA